LELFLPNHHDWSDVSLVTKTCIKNSVLNCDTSYVKQFRIEIADTFGEDFRYAGTGTQTAYNAETVTSIDFQAT